MNNHVWQGKGGKSEFCAMVRNAPGCRTGKSIPQMTVWALPFVGLGWGAEKENGGGY